jgi:hypothetical protein
MQHQGFVIYTCLNGPSIPPHDFQISLILLFVFECILGYTSTFFYYLIVFDINRMCYIFSFTQPFLL